ncbi:hypothetical protein BPAE_0039g00630 [Botrytis paeoniae]|uniref:Heterokaryon incompatibility domain-containing protein n=1 Tax=Botrytis paeoniae TaxID=278948 RepID=A0A4Z1G052_9HELO|nr:hypothetical protein BPAE_0039g00630 [Botrytis paeoniae]
MEEDEIQCRCGDEAHKNLEEWYKGYPNNYYSATKGGLFNDKFNEYIIKKKIDMLLPQIPVFNNYCFNCQKFLDKMSDIIMKIPGYQPDTVWGLYQCPCFKDSFEFEASYRNGCRLCILWVRCSNLDGNSFETWHRLQNRLSCLRKSTAILVSIRRAIRNDEENFWLSLTFPGHKGDSHSSTSRLYCVKNCDQRRFILGEDSAPLLSANESISQLHLAKKWLNACSETHESCKSATDHQLPTRLIDVISNPIHLVSSSIFTSKPRYTTLSHCWGTKDFVKLEEDSLESFMIKIPEEKLTKTFRDAVYIARSLDLRYLWIDSLCIIQLSESDWRKEAALMSSVYSGSTINIVAASAIDGTKGCFLKPPSFSGNVQIQPTKNEVWDIGPDAFYDSVVGSPVANRAWCLQERLLAPRSLHFTQSELFWECQHCDASESFPDYYPQVSPPTILHRDHDKPLSDIWHTIVQLYTSTNLTFAKDKLVAISGLAQLIQKKNRDLYLAGLWWNDIELQLLWSQSLPGRRLPIGSKYRAPSWSWASVDEMGGVLYPSRSDTRDYIFCSHVIDAHVVPAGNDPFGELMGGALEMSCSTMVRGKLKEREPESKVEEYRDVEIESLDGKKETFRVKPDANECEGEDICIVPVVDSWWKESKYSGRSFEGLLLLPRVNKKGEYTRAGVFKFNVGDKKSQGNLERFLKLMKQSGKAIAEAYCAKILKEPKFGNELYVITII